MVSKYIVSTSLLGTTLILSTLPVQAQIIPDNSLGSESSIVTLGVLGNANLFLINPNGIVFASNATLDVGGSFFASTPDGILFENGVEFAASNPDASPLLTINIPIGLNFRENPGNIVNQSIAVDREDNFVGLEVLPQKTLGLVGGNILLENSVLTALLNSSMNLRSPLNLQYNEFDDLSLVLSCEEREQELLYL